MNRNDKQFMVQKIRAQYMEREASELDELRALDWRVKRPANIFGYVFGSISAIVMGCGMSLVMTDIGNTVGIQNSMAVGIVVGALGLAAAALTYPIYKKLLVSRKKRYADEIIKISESIIGK